MTNEQIKNLALQAGFKLKEQADGTLDLNPYVYEFTKAIEEHCWSAWQSGLPTHKIHNKLNNGWVSVDVMLPEPMQKVLVLGETYEEINVIEVGQFDPKMVTEVGVNESFLTALYVTHWQPLPQPPKE